MYYEAHTYDIDTKEWSLTSFETKRIFRDYIDTQVKYPSEYNIKYAHGVWNEQAIHFQTKGYYPKFPLNSLDYKNHWNKEKEKSALDGVVIYKKPSENIEFAVPGLLYFYLNYCPILDKIKKKNDLPEIYDGDYHYCLYLLRCILHGRFAAVLKKRQSGYTLKNTAAIVLKTFFGEQAICKIFAIDEAAVIDSWGLMETYKQHINKHTAWFRNFSPDKVLDWQIKTKMNDGSITGSLSLVKGFSTKLDASKGVGGNIDILFGEECYGENTKVLTSNGEEKNVQDIKVGDILLGPDGSPVNVCRTVSGETDLFLIEQNKGESYVTTGNHILVLDYRKYYDDSITEVEMTVNEVLSLMDKNQFNNSHFNYYGKKSKGLKFKKQETDLSPYYIGLWLGDGYKKSAEIIVNKTKDIEIYTWLMEYAKKMEIEIKEGLPSITNRLLYKDDMIILKYRKNSITGVHTNQRLKGLNIFNNKHIPNHYLFNEEGVRLELLAGIIDSDGCLNKGSKSYNFSYEIACSKTNLAEQIVFLSRSLGFYTRIKKKKTNYINKQGEINYTNIIVIRGDIHKIPVKNSRKKVPMDWKPTSDPLHTIIKIKHVGIGRYYGFTLDNDTKQHLLRDFTISHNSGKNPTLDKTHGYVTSNVSLGGLTTGLIIYSGAVGELDKCEPLKEYILRPVENNFLECPNLIDEDAEFGAVTGFFAPEWWNFVTEDPETGEMVKCFDKDGNTNKELAMSYILEQRKKAELASAEAYRYFCSQRPLSIKEAFDYRKDSVFPQALLTRQEHRIDRGDYPYTLHDIERGGEGKPSLVINRHPEITQFPFHPKKGEIPYGCIKIWEKPILNAKWGTYLAAVDPIVVDITSTSESLFSVIIYRNLTEELYQEGGEDKVKLSGDRIVASYIGRKEDIAHTNEVAELLLEYYNAFAVIENNVDNFVRHMISKQKQKYMATKSDLPFLKDMDTNTSSYQEYGVRTNVTMWGHYINKILEYIKEETDIVMKDDGSVYKKVYGIEKIPDKRLIKELQKFTDIKGNYDQIITLGLVLALAKARQINGLVSKVDNRTDAKANLQLYRVDRGAFNTLGGRSKSSENTMYTKQPFRNLK